MIYHSKPLFSKLGRLARNRKGATTIEYAMAALVIAVPVAATLPAIASTVKGHYNKTADGFDVNNPKDPAATPKS